MIAAFSETTVKIKLDARFLFMALIVNVLIQTAECASQPGNSVILQTVVEPELRNGLPRETIALHEYLWAVCGRLNCYFTVERYEDEYSDANRPETWSMLTRGTTSITNTSQIVSVDALVRVLRVNLPGCHIERDGVNPSIIHLMDRELVASMQYPLNRKVSLKHEGLLYYLPDELGKHFKGVHSKIGFAVGLPIVHDMSTRIAFEVRDAPVRGLFSNYTPLAAAPVHLWTATTVWEEGQFVEAEVEIFGAWPSK